MNLFQYLPLSTRCSAFCVYKRKDKVMVLCTHHIYLIFFLTTLYLKSVSCFSIRTLLQFFWRFLLIYNLLVSLQNWTRPPFRDFVIFLHFSVSVTISHSTTVHLCSLICKLKLYLKEISFARKYSMECKISRYIPCYWSPKSMLHLINWGNLHYHF